jgi:hypothetical protein
MSQNNNVCVPVDTASLEIRMCEPSTKIIFMAKYIVFTCPFISFKAHQCNIPSQDS